MDFYILDSSDECQWEKWINIWQRWNTREVFAHPEYVKLFCNQFDRALCVVQESSTGLILLPLILRPLSMEPWADKQHNYYDAISPYGYGGPYTEGDFNLGIFWREFRHWSTENKILSAFFRFSPVSADIREFVGDVEECGSVIIRSLGEGKDAVWMDYKHAVRTCIRCAEQHGLRIEIDELGTRLQDFMRIYYRTMDRRNASKQYYFPQKFFRNLIGNLQGHFAFFHVVYQDMVIASKLVLTSQEHIYPYLGGSDQEHFNVYPNQFLDHAIFNWGIDQGKKNAVLGGGYDGMKDGVFQYKKKFAPLGEVPFLIGKYIGDRFHYNDMVEKRKQFEEGTQGNRCEEAGFFPEYRRKSD